MSAQAGPHQPDTPPSPESETGEGGEGLDSELAAPRKQPVPTCQLAAGLWSVEEEGELMHERGGKGGARAQANLLRGERERVRERLYREGGVRVLDLRLGGGVEERLLALHHTLPSLTRGLKLQGLTCGGAREGGAGSAAGLGLAALGMAWEAAAAVWKGPGSGSLPAASQLLLPVSGMPWEA